MTRFLVTGASGLLGLNLSLLAVERGHQVVGTVNRHLLRHCPFPLVKADFSKTDHIRKIIDQTKPDVIIHTAALAEIDACERQPKISQKVNADLPGEIAGLTARLGIRFIHISTDAVFDGVKGHYREDDRPNPLSVYARHKLEAEENVCRYNPEAAIARVNFFGWSINGTRSLAEWFFKKLTEGTRVKGFTDIFFCPLMVIDLSELLLMMVEKKVKGIYHVLSTQSISKYDFGIQIARSFGLDASLITPTSWKEGGLEAMRSPNLILDVSKLERDMGITPPAPAEGIQKFYQLWQNGYAKKIFSMSPSDHQNA